MKNPLIKRLPRELKSEIGKYMVIFIFMVATIGLVSGFLVSDNSLLKSYNESFEKYNIEDGNFEVPLEMDKDVLDSLEDDVKIYKNYYIEEDTDVDLDGEKYSTLRIFKNRQDVNKICLMKGRLPETLEEIAIDRMYADNNKISVGDKIKVGSKELKVTALVALSDYSALFSDNGDMMFDAVKFGVAIMTEEGFTSFEKSNIHYSYSWKYKNEPSNETKEKEQADEFLKKLAVKTQVKGYVPRYGNQAIKFTGEDMGGDKSLIITLLYIVIVIMAFVFAVTTNNIITKEAKVVGTLRASGYTKGELVSHYISLPIIVTLIASVVGNILGYTVFKDIFAGLYYGSYSLPTYETLWNGEAFILTTIVPIVMMVIINLAIVANKLTLSPLKFLRNDLSKKKNSKAVKLPKFKFINRFRLRIILQNKGNYITLLIGIIFANVLLLFGLMLKPLLVNYQDKIENNMLAKYQYVLKMAVDTKSEEAEKYCVSSLETIPDKYDTEDVTVYGIKDNSKYVSMDNVTKDGVYVSSIYADKYKVDKGDTITIKEKYGDKKYTLKIEGVYDYLGAIAVFMPIDEYRDVFDKNSDYYNGYFSNEEIDDISKEYILSTITKDDLTKLSRQLQLSMGDTFQIITIFSVVLSMILIYLLTKIIIEKNGTSISMVKILGYDNKEISGLYLMATTWMVILFTGLSLFISTEILKTIYYEMMASMKGWIPIYIKSIVYLKMFVIGILVYGIVAAFQFRKIKKIPMDEALKNIE